MLPEETDEEDEGYTPEPVMVPEESAVILDPVEFEAEFNAYAVMMRGGILWVLDKDTKTWRDVEPGGKQKSKLRPVN